MMERRDFVELVSYRADFMLRYANNACLAMGYNSEVSLHIKKLLSDTCGWFVARIGTNNNSSYEIKHRFNKLEEAFVYIIGYDGDHIKYVYGDFIKYHGSDEYKSCFDTL
jgi:hypothetical protein